MYFKYHNHSKLSSGDLLEVIVIATDFFNFVNVN